MTTRVNSREVELRRKGRMARANRWLGWVTFTCFALPAVSGWLNSLGLPFLPDSFTGAMSVAFWVLIFLHAIAGVYLYGLPEWSRNLRIVHMYLGFSVFAFILANRSLVFVPPFNQITAALMWVPILAHVGLGARFLVQRVIGKMWDPPLRFYTGGQVVRDAVEKQQG